jgi:hypothetical protein
MAAGRPKGSLNHESKAVKEMVFAALNNAGGTEYLTQQAKDNPSAFMTMVGKLLPKDINLGGQDDNPLTLMVQKVERQIVDTSDKDATLG